MVEKQARRLYLLRHAKSDRPAMVDDIERPLAGRGRRDAKAVAGFLARKLTPELVLCSPSLRTRQTWQLARQGFTRSPAVRFEPVIYGAHWKELVDLLRDAPADARAIMIIGHEPTMSEMALKLAGAGSNKSVVRQVATKFPTAAIATFELPGPWVELGPGAAKLLAFDINRG